MLWNTLAESTSLRHENNIMTQRLRNLQIIHIWSCHARKECLFSARRGKLQDVQKLDLVLAARQTCSGDVTFG
jgi:hypothetical protein